MKTKIFTKARGLMMLILATMISTNVWAVDPPTLSDLSFPSPSIDENFNDVSTTSTTSRFNAISTAQSGYGDINHLYNNNQQNQNTIAISAAGNNMTSNYFSLTQGSTNLLIGQISGGDDFAQSGAWRITIEKSSTYYFGLFNNASSQNAFGYNDVSVFLRNVNGTISIQDGSSSSHWTEVGSSTNNTIDICVVYNLTNAGVTYGGSISLASMKAHVYIDGTCVNSAGTPTAFTLAKNATITAFRIATNSNSTHAYVDDIKVYKSLPGAGALSVSYNANGKDGGGAAPTDNTAYSSGATVTVLGNPNSMTRTGCTFSGWATAADGTGDSYVEDETFSITANTTLYAKWAATVTWVVNGSTARTDNIFVPAAGKSVTPPSDPTTGSPNCGDKFMGWTTTNIGSTGIDKSQTSEISALNLFTGAKNVTGTTTFYAVFADYAE